MTYQSCNTYYYSSKHTFKLVGVRQCQSKVIKTWSIQNSHVLSQS